MFTILDDKTICLTRGDIANLVVSAIQENGFTHKFSVDDVIRFKVYKRKDCGKVMIQKDVTVSEECEEVTIFLTSEETRIGELINKPEDYWYEIEVNPETAPQTIIGYDEHGAKIFRLFPEGSDLGGN